MAGWDDPQRLGAFLDAVRWGTVTSADTRTLQAPFRSGISIEEYQLEPVARALAMPRVNLLIAAASTRCSVPGQAVPRPPRPHPGRRWPERQRADGHADLGRYRLSDRLVLACLLRRGGPAAVQVLHAPAALPAQGVHHVQAVRPAVTGPREPGSAGASTSKLSASIMRHEDVVSAERAGRGR